MADFRMQVSMARRRRIAGTHHQASTTRNLRINLMTCGFDEYHNLDIGVGCEHWALAVG